MQKMSNWLLYNVALMGTGGVGWEGDVPPLPPHPHRLPLRITPLADRLFGLIIQIVSECEARCLHLITILAVQRSDCRKGGGGREREKETPFVVNGGKQRRETDFY